MKFSLFDGYKNIPIDGLLAELGSVPGGLTSKTAAERIEVFGYNETIKKKKVHFLIELLRRFRDPLVMILIVAATVSGFVGEFKNTVIILFMVVLSVTMNFYQEHKSGKVAEKLVERLATKATVLRDGKKVDILVKYIVPGDVVALSAGDIIPADGRILESDDFFVNESALTGESYPVEKVVSGGKQESEHIVSAGTNVVSGWAQYAVVRTGRNTEYGAIAEKATEPLEVNAFEVGIKSFGYLIIKATVFIVCAVFFINIILHKSDLFEAFIFSVAVAVGLTPELLPVIMSVNMAKGSLKMAKKGVIVKRLNAIPDFGSMDILCTDKTGTLTEDRIEVVKYIDMFGEVSEDVLRSAYINGFFETGLKAPMELAILNFRHIDVTGIKKIDEIPYDFMRKRLSVIVEEKSNRIMITKGAPEEIFKISTKYRDGGKESSITEEVKKRFLKVYDDLSSQGFRVLAVAEKDVEDNKKVYPRNEEALMTLRGFIAFLDPPKKSVKETLRFMAHHGIEVKIITGDNPLVTKKICEELEFEIKGIMLGAEVDQIDDEALVIRAKEINIFARFSPNQKDRIISALRRGGHVVGYLGDGINDAPSLKSADVGISVSNAVDVAKETADIVLMHKSLKELVDGVIEGRKTFGNTMKYLMMGLSSNFGNMFSMIGAALFLPFLPMLPVQILFNNFLYDFSQVTIPTDNVDAEYLKKPKQWNMKFIQHFMFVFGPISSLFDFLTFYLLFAVLGLSGGLFQTGWFIESLATQVLVVYIIRTRKLPFIQSRPSLPLLLSTLGVVVVGGVFATTALGTYFGFVPLPPIAVFSIAGLVAVYLILVELGKHLFYRKYNI